jgi:hypothetical protein
LHCYNFIILFSIFSANDFIKKKCFFVPINLNNWIKIYRAITLFSGIFLVAESEDMKVFILSVGDYQVDLFFSGYFGQENKVIEILF